MKRIFLLVIFVSSLFICSCTNDKAKQLQSKFNEEIKVETQYKRGNKAKVAAAQYAEMEHNLNNKFVNDLSSMIENTLPKCPTIPVCPQSWILHLLMIWEPIFSFVQPSSCAWQMQSRSVCVPSLYFHFSHLLSLFGCLFFPRDIPVHLECEISQSSINHPLDQ